MTWASGPSRVGRTCGGRYSLPCTATSFATQSSVRVGGHHTTTRSLQPRRATSAGSNAVKPKSANSLQRPDLAMISASELVTGDRHLLLLGGPRRDPNTVQLMIKIGSRGTMLPDSSATETLCCSIDVSLICLHLVKPTRIAWTSLDCNAHCSVHTKARLTPSHAN